ncbi:hypothetical protein QBC38DRAFT_482953 [Podospora fimiseda]|uniref:Uncharacterized protein n=1 Tax=Podospora fimiseda TaxID=252190 RepID=A0AAN7BLA9_9PEZI|nr:hypothetical protein QBC38DRAFT_482953 [Podospora fimiseda]
MADTCRKGTNKSTATANTTSSTSSSATDKVIVFELNNYRRRTATRKSLEDIDIERKYSFEIRRWQRHVDVTLPGDDKRKEASAHIAKVKLPIQARIGRIFGRYKELWAVSIA